MTSPLRSAEYDCVVLTSSGSFKARCYGCQAHGPVAALSGRAIDLAEDNGWRQFQGQLFCPACRRIASTIIARRADENLFSPLES